MNYDVVLYVLVIDFLAIMSPGPDFFMILKNSLSYSRREGVFTALGITVGSGILFSLSLFGVGVIVAQSKVLFTIIKIAGALYLLYLAVMSIMAKVSIHEPQLLDKTNNKTNDFASFKMGLICNMTNPKAMMFMVSLSSYVTTHGNVKLDSMAIIIGSMILTQAWFSSISGIFGSLKVRKVFYRKQRIVNIIFAMVLVYVASKILFL